MAKPERALLGGDGMKCPICGEGLFGIRNELYECLTCFYIGTFRDILELKHLFQRADALVEAIEMEIEHLYDARREAVLRHSVTYLKAVLHCYGLRDISGPNDAVCRIDTLIEAKKTELERLLEALREAKTRGSTTYLKKVLSDQGFRILKPEPIPIVTKVGKKSVRRKIGLMIASAQATVFLNWFANSFDGLMNGGIPLAQGVVPILLLLESIVLVVVASEGFLS